MAHCTVLSVTDDLYECVLFSLFAFSQIHDFNSLVDELYLRIHDAIMAPTQLGDKTHKAPDSTPDPSSDSAPDNIQDGAQEQAQNGRPADNNESPTQQ